MQERKTSLNDDYVKFIRLAQDYIDRNEEGIIGFVTNRSFIENPTFRGMRWSLMKSFDKIYILDLHGDTKEDIPKDKNDKNVFDIQQGVCISHFVKTGQKDRNALGKVYHSEIIGSRESKYQALEMPWEHSFYHEVESIAPYYFFVPKREEGKEEYQEGVSIADLFVNKSLGAVSSNDTLNISFTREEQENKIKDLIQLDEETWRMRYNRRRDSRDWTYQTAKTDAKQNQDKLYQISYRPFDVRYTCYSGNSRGLYASPQCAILNHLKGRQNVALCAVKTSRDYLFPIFVANHLVDKTLLSSKDNATVFPLFVYCENMGKEECVPNFNQKIYQKIQEGLGETVSPTDLFDYIYAVLHSPSYRKRYEEFLKIDFPRIPYPTDLGEFRRLADIGAQLRRLHLMEGLPTLTGITFPVAGTNVVDRCQWEGGRVYINATQYFDGVTEEAFQHYIGGYQPAQKWLKDRRGRTLDFDDVRHYERIIYALDATCRLMSLI